MENFFTICSSAFPNKNLIHQTVLGKFGQHMIPISDGKGSNKLEVFYNNNQLLYYYYKRKTPNINKNKFTHIHLHHHFPSRHTK